MQNYTGKLSKELAEKYDPKFISKSEPFLVETFPELVAQVAHLAYYNKNQLLFFRGQGNDYTNRKNSSTFLPSIYRGDYVAKNELEYRFDILEEASKEVSKRFAEEKITGYSEFKRKKLMQWSILQHYEVCSTPLLDFTQSLRVACSFAFLKNETDFAYIFVFGLPYLTNRISSNSEEDIVNIRLLSITPPDALRPFYQEGYLAGTTDVTSDYDSKSELDFNNRLIMKFKIPVKQSFWGSDFNIIPESALYPKQDKILEICNDIKLNLNDYLKSGDIGDFLKEWNDVEKILLKKANLTQRHYSVIEAVKALNNENKLDMSLAYQIDYLRRFRNNLVHNLSSVNSHAIQDYMQTLLNVKQELKKLK
ncbi:FRG domain-containing protein [Flavobacterium polysaccharolyticum]|uniref:FRG domain-containing protein n=1 Tax=Flavobacterium polysaccharolyticum TaxID=3133148 RepID=A0ABU9NNH3_9FLAO